MEEKVIQRLESLGYLPTEAGTYLLTLAIERAENTIKNACNIKDIPKELETTAVDMACGEVLTVKKAGGQLTAFDTEGAIKQVKEGDSQYTYAVSEGKSPLDSLLDHLLYGGLGQLVSYRRLQW